MNALTKLTNAEIAHCPRHLILPEIGLKGHEKLKDSKILLVGTGGSLLSARSLHSLGGG